MKLAPVLALGALLLGFSPRPAPAYADDTTPATIPSTTMPDADARDWLDARGMMSVSDLEKTLGTRFTGDERAKMEALLAQRNASIRGFNERISAALREKLTATDAQVAQRVEKKTDADKEALELERIRRHQPSRYQEIMRRKKREAAKAAASAGTSSNETVPDGTPDGAAK